MKYYTPFSFLILVAWANLGLCQNQNPLARIADGELRGKYLQSRGDKTYAAFLGVPYAKPPKRFLLAEFPEAWEGTRDATKFGNQCWQVGLLPGLKDPIFGSEDCLFANIYAPEKMSKKNLPVMVFIHGGAFSSGSADMIGADFLMDHDVILVTINYRLGPFGFLSTGDGVIESNLGLKDQHLALKWVQKNIDAFGGDKKKVTLFGESAGGASVHYQLLSPLNEGLFHNAIIQSGSATNPWAYTDNPVNAAAQLGDALGCNTHDSKKLVKCLKEKDPKEILKVDQHEWHLDPITIFPPTKDSPHSKQILIPDNPIKLLEAGKFLRIPTLITLCEDEGILIHSAVVSRTEHLRNEINKDWQRILPITLYYNRNGLSQTEQNWLSSEVKKFYFGEQEIGVETFTNLTNMYSDRLFVRGIEEITALHARYTTVYNAVFAYKGKNSLLAMFGINENLGVAHGDDMQYLFSGNMFATLEKNSADEKMSKFYVSMIIKFAITGKPEFKWENVNWMPYSTRGEPTWFNLNFPPDVLQNPFKKRMEFWNRVLARSKHDEL